MSKSFRNATTGLLLVAACMLGINGCDMLSSNEGGLEQNMPAGKLRHEHLLPSASSSKTGADSVNLVIGYDPVYSAQRVFRTYRVFRRYRVVRRYEFEHALNGEAITVGAADLQALLDSLENDPSVAWIEPDYDVPPAEINPDAWQVNQQRPSWAINDINAHRSYFGSGDGRDRNGVPDVDLYVLDSGADSPDLNVAECLEVQGQAFAPCRSTRDLLGHGTAVAGVAAARDNAVGVVGTAPGAPVYVVRTLNAAGYTTESHLIKAIDLVTQRKRANPSRPMVMNLSFGAYVGTTAFTAMDEAVQGAIDAGVVVVVSAGNDGEDASLYSPAHVPDAITVGAYSKDNKLSWFSNYGPVVDILAPGDGLEVLYTGDDANKLMRESGTSFAAPHVAGAAAVVLAGNPDWTTQQVRDHLVQRARDIRPDRGTTRKALNMDNLGSRR